MNICDEIEIITDFVKVDKKYLKLCTTIEFYLRKKRFL